MLRPTSPFVLLAVAACLAGCSRPAEPPSPSGDGGAAEDASAPGAGTPAGRADRVVYDEDGVPVVDSTRLAMGTAIPRGFEKVYTSGSRVTYRGMAPADKVVRFYRRYLFCSHVTEHERGYEFTGATPRSPGDESRTVDVFVIPVGRTASQVIVIDRSGGTPAPADAGGPEYFEDLREKAHQGVGSVKAPIPGTY